MNLEESVYSIALRACPLVGDINFMKIISATGSAKESWLLSKSILREIEGIGSQTTKGIGEDKYLKFAEEEVNFCEKNNIKIRLRHLNQLPYLLSECPDAPAILYQKGDFDESRKMVSIVGTRKITAYGRRFVEELAEQLKDKNISVVSGLALGTDACAHQEALKNNIPTLGILAHGLHLLYPSEHRKLAKEMLEKDGALLTEFNSSHKPDREHFLQRNRVVAGLSQVTVVVESAFGGGSMSTANYANQYNREVFALSGRISDKYSQGCNLLIAQNKARIISSIQDIVEELGEAETEKQGQLFAPKEIELEESIKPIYELIEKHSPVSLDEISERLGILPFKLLPILLDLELRGYIKALAGRQYTVN